MKLPLFGKNLLARSRQKEGKKGEEIAQNFFSERGYKIIARNYRTRYGEIDLICSKGNLLVFVEVRRRNRKGFGEPQESLSGKKIEKIKRTAEYFLAERGINDKEIRFDLFCIAGEKLELIPNAF
jgi:putative endonuclease